MSEPTPPPVREKLGVQSLADAKKLPASFLRMLGLHDLPNGQGIGIPYYGDTPTKLLLTKRRTAFVAKDGSYWPAGVPLCAYGQWRIGEALEHNFLILVEGESDCWTLWHHSFPALGLPGAGAARTLTPALLKDIPRIYIHVEPDQGGELFREGILRRLAEIPGEREVLSFSVPLHAKDPSGLHCDAPAHFKGHLWAALDSATKLATTVQATSAAASPTPCPEPQTISLALVKPETVRWLWPGRIPMGKLTILDGDPGLGKSSVTLDLAARLTRGLPMPCSETNHPPANVVLLTAEDGLGDTIRPRAETCGADLSKVFALQGVKLSNGSSCPIVLPENIGQLARVVEGSQAKLVLIDPLLVYLSDACNAHNDQNVRRALLPLAQLAESSGAAILVVRHLNKQGGKIALYRGGGSIGIIGAARSGLLICKDPESPQQRLLAVTKSNLCKSAKTLRFELVDAGDTARVNWLDEIDLDIDDVLADAGKDEIEPAHEADEFLRECLKGGPVLATQIFQEGAEQHISGKSLKRAKKRLGIESQRVGEEDGHPAHYLWLPPKSA